MRCFGGSLHSECFLFIFRWLAMSNLSIPVPSCDLFLIGQNVAISGMWSSFFKTIFKNYLQYKICIILFFFWWYKWTALLSPLKKNSPVDFPFGRAKQCSGCICTSAEHWYYGLILTQLSGFGLLAYNDLYWWQGHINFLLNSDRLKNTSVFVMIFFGG